MKSLLTTASLCLLMSLSAHADLLGRKVLMTADFVKSAGDISIDGQDIVQKDQCNLIFHKAVLGDRWWESVPDTTFLKGLVFGVTKSESGVSAFNGLFTVWSGKTVVELMPLKDSEGPVTADNIDGNVGVKIECNTTNYFTATGAKMNTKSEKAALKVYDGLQLLK